MSSINNTSRSKDSEVKLGEKYNPLEPALPFVMPEAIARGRSNSQALEFVRNTTEMKYHQRIEACNEAFGTENYAEVRKLAGRLKQQTLDNLDVYLNQFIDKAESAGITLHYALDGQEANAICVDIAQRNQCKLCVKSKSMVTEEIRLVPAMEQSGIEVIETDLGEFIIQLDNDKPAHIVAPMIHKNRADTGRAFARELPGVKYTENVQELAAIARKYMREKFCKADMGITGANFLVANTGQVVVCTNEGNADLVTIGPRVLVVVAGLEKVVRNMQELAIYLKLLARSGTAQPLTVYTTFIGQPPLAGNFNGITQQIHIVLVDNKRTELLQQPESNANCNRENKRNTRELLRCIRCGACLNACPVYRKAGGGHAYGSVYSGPIGAAITPVLQGLENYSDLPKASSLCGVCYEACPVNINLPQQLIMLRSRAVDNGVGSKISERMFYKAWGWCTKYSYLYQLAASILRFILHHFSSSEFATESDGESDTDNKAAESNQRKWLTKKQMPVTYIKQLDSWLDNRDLAVPSDQSFHSWWKKHKSNIGNNQGG